MLRKYGWFAGCALVLWVASPSLAQGNQQLADLNAEALEAYQNLDIDTAKAKLEQGIALAGRTNYRGPELAQLYMTLGVVHVAGASDHDQGLSAFVSALCTQPDAQLDPLLSTPDVQQVFIQAQSDAQQQGCAAGGAPAYVPPPSQVGFASSSGPQVDDRECPPGVVCGGDEGGGRRGKEKFARWFVNLQFGFSFGFVQPGMPTDSKPPLGEIFREREVPVEFDMMGNPTRFETRYLFDDTSGWVPDADSFDDYEVIDATSGRIIVPRGTTPVSAQCEADGVVTGPPSVPNAGFTTLEPSSYCVRVAASGFVPGYTLRLTPGYFITESFAVSLPLRFQLDSSGGAFGAIQLGARGELLFSKMDSATGFPISWFFGASYGQIEVKPPPKDPARAVPWAIGGPIGVNTGVNVRFRLHRNFGLIASPQVDLFLPDLLFNIELALGAEAAF